MASNDLFRLLRSSSEEAPLEQVKELLQKGADPCEQFGSSGSSALLLGAEKGHENLLHLLLEKCDKARLRLTRVDGLNALMLAASLGHGGCVSLLLATGNYRGHMDEKAGPRASRSTALLLACAGGHVAVAMILLQNGADPNVCDSLGRFPIHLASAQGYMELVEALERNGARLGEVDIAGHTAMHLCPHPPILEFLYSHGVSPITRDRQGSTPLQVLQRLHGDPAAVSLLERLEEGDRRRRTVANRGPLVRTVHRLMWTLGDVLRDAGWKVVLAVLILVFVIAWQTTVHIHGRPPFPTNI